MFMKPLKPWTDHDIARLRLEVEREAKHAPHDRAVFEERLARVLAYPVAELHLRHAMGQIWYMPDAWPSLDILARPLIVTEHRANHGLTSDVLIGVEGSPPRGTLWVVGVPVHFTLLPDYAMFQSPHKPPAPVEDPAWLHLVRAFLEERAIHGGGPRPVSHPWIE